MSKLPNLSLTVVGLSDGSSTVAVDATLPCDEHGVHRVEERFTIARNELADQQGLWLQATLSEIADRYCPRWVR